MIGVAVLAVLLAVVWAVTAFLYRRDARAAHATIASRDRLIGEKNERLTILADALDAERSAHRATTATLDHYVAQSVILSAKLTQAEPDRDNATVLVEQLTHDIAVNA